MNYLNRVMRITVVMICVTGTASTQSANLISNGTFEAIEQDRPQNWHALWTREPEKGNLVIDKTTVHAGNHAARINHTGKEDWSLTSNTSIPVAYGDTFTLSAWVRIEGKGNATVCVTTYDAEDQAVNWSAGSDTVSGTHEWVLLESGFMVPRGVVRIVPRLIGYGEATVWADDVVLEKTGNILSDQAQGAPDSFVLENKQISLLFSAESATFQVTDLRTGNVTRQKAAHGEIVIQKLVAAGTAMEIHGYDGANGLFFKAVVQVSEKEPEFSLSITSKGKMRSPLRFPHPFITEAGTYLVVPMNEGISYPVEDASINPMRLIAYGGHGISMGFWGATDGAHGHMAILETPDDASIRMDREGGLLNIAPEWEGQKERFGYERKLRYVFFDKGGHVAMCKRYRTYAKSIGLLKTLEEKRQENPKVDLLIGAVNVWCWERGAVNIINDLQSVGIDHILWSHRRPPHVIEKMNAIEGVLSSRYDIYQDLQDPETVKKHLTWAHPDWTQTGWPHDLMLDQYGAWRKGWAVKGKDGAMHAGGVLCDKQAIPYARERVGNELKTHAYRSRFIDTTTASPWRECYHPDHPMTRTESKYWKMELLRLMSEEMKLVTGSETGHEAAVPYVHYFEGMMSLGPYRVPDAGRDMGRIWDEVPERVAKFQTGHQYRLPLWELVYHDCVVSQWYWGDYNNKLPALWDKRDLFNALYGTPPMFMFPANTWMADRDKQYWAENKERFAQSYRNVCSIARKVGYAEMIDHQFLTPDRSVQQTTFANGIRVTVNFGENTYQLESGEEVVAMGIFVREE
jgi:hypothetical protein